MRINTISSRDFNQKVGHAKLSAKKGPVFITDRGEPTHVLLNIDDYRKMTTEGPTLGELLGNPAAAAIEFDIEPRRKDSVLSMEFE